MDDILFTEAYDAFVGRIGGRHAGVQLGQDHVTGKGQARTLIYIREFNTNELNAETIPGSSCRHIFKRKVYDRLDSNDTNHAIGIGFVSESPTQLPDCSVSMSHKMNLLYKDLFCYHFNYSYIGMPLRTPLPSRAPDCEEGITNLARKICPSVRVTSSLLSGSEMERLKAPPVIIKTKLKTKRMEGEEEDVELVEGSDYDVMIIMEGIVSEENSCVASKIKINAAIETISSAPGYLRLRLLQNDSVKQDLPHVFDSDTGSYYLKSCACDPMASADIKLLFKEIKERREWLSYLMEQEPKGPAIKHLFLVKINSPDCENHLPRYNLMEFDIVGAFQYSTWPKVAEEWLERQRLHGWPSREIIETIKLGGCHIVGTSHPQSLRPDIEFRFSFSSAENVLSESLSHQQKQCYTAFKAIIKHEIRELENETRLEVKVKSYHLKNIFLWACEAIPQEDWSQFHQWPRCLLFLIDRLLRCLERRTMPGYFIRSSNLFAEIEEETVNFLIQRIVGVRFDPLTAAIRFLKTTVLYRPEHICLERTFARVLRANAKCQSTNKDICLQTLKCWQRLLIDFDCGSNPKFGKKASILEAFANWCRAAEISIPLSDCLSPQLSLFDAVFLDIVHNFDVDESIIKAFAVHEPSHEVSRKLAACYREFVCGEKTVLNIETRNAFIRKACLLYENSLHVKSICNAVEFAIFMYENGRYDECIQLLKLLELENTSTYVKSENLFHSKTVNCFIKMVFGHKIDNRINGEDICVPSLSIILLLFVICHICIGSIEEAFPVMERFEQYFKESIGFETPLSFYIFGFCKEQLGMKETAAECFRMALQSKLLTTTQRFEQSRNGETTTKRPCTHLTSLFDLLGLSTGVFASESEANNFFSIMSQRLSEIPFSGSYVVKIILFLTATYKSSSCGHCRNIFSSYCNEVHMLILATRWSVTQHIPSSSNLLYYAHLVMLYTVGESVLSILLDVIAREEDAPLSVIVWPKQFRILADDCIRREIDKADDRGFIAIPSLSYAYYLLAKLYLRLRKMDSFSETMAKFEELCRRIGDMCSVSCSLLADAYHQHLNWSSSLEYHDTNSCTRDSIEDDTPCSDVARAGHGHVASSASAFESAERSFRRDSHLFELWNQISMNIMDPIFNSDGVKLLNEQMKDIAEAMADATCAHCICAT